LPLCDVIALTFARTLLFISGSLENLYLLEFALMSPIRLRLHMKYPDIGSLTFLMPNTKCDSLMAPLLINRRLSDHPSTEPPFTYLDAITISQLEFLSSSIIFVMSLVG